MALSHSPLIGLTRLYNKAFTSAEVSQTITQLKVDLVYSV